MEGPLRSPVLVLGGAGFLGSHVCQSLAEQGFQVISYDIADPMEGSALLTGEATRTPKFVHGDIFDRKRLADCIRRFGVRGMVDTLAGGGDEAGNREDPEPTIRINVQGTFNALETARRQGVGRFVYVSTGGVYGSRAGRDSQAPVREEEPITWRGTIYHPSHYMGEILVEMYHQVYGLDTVVIRPLSMYGPALSKTLGGDWPGSAKFHDVWLQRGLQGAGVIEVRGSDTLTDLTYVRDVADGVRLAYTAEALSHRLFNVSSGRLVSHRQIAEAIQSHFPSVELQFHPGVQENPLRPNQGPLDISRARRVLGFEPRYDLQRGMAEYITWLRRAGKGLRAG